MSFYTTLYFYRPTRPPRVTGPRLAEFIEALCATGVIERRADYIMLKFGRGIDQDEKPTSYEVPVPGVRGMYTVRSIKWDINHSSIPLDERLQLLRNHDRPLYRATLSIGSVRRDVMEALQTPRPDEAGQMNLTLWDCVVSLEPVELGSMSTDDRFAVGWMSLSFSGNGYLYPWTPRDLTSRADALAALTAVTDVCRQFFPVDPDGAPKMFQRIAPRLRRLRLRRTRRQMGELWPFPDDLDRPWDWFWGVSETG
jgi:hypothetical protein